MVELDFVSNKALQIISSDFLHWNVFFFSFFVYSPHLELKPLKLKFQNPKGQYFSF